MNSIVPPDDTPGPAGAKSHAVLGPRAWRSGRLTPVRQYRPEEARCSFYGVLSSGTNLTSGRIDRSLDVGIRDRDRLAERPAALGRDDDHADGRRTLEHGLPLVLCEVQSVGQESTARVSSRRQSCVRRSARMSAKERTSAWS